MEDTTKEHKPFSFVFLVQTILIVTASAELVVGAERTHAQVMRVHNSIISFEGVVRK